MEDRRMQERTRLIVADITAIDVDAIVNAANEQLARGAGVCGAIFRAAGPQLDAACRELAPCPTGQARITPGFEAKARWIVHAVGPVWYGGNANEDELLASAYTSALQLSCEAGAASIAFPSISTGIYGYPRERAARIATHTVAQWCSQSNVPATILYCCFSESDAAIYRHAHNAH